MEGFSILCTTCRARLRVRDDRIVGQIVPCPKCGSMVLIQRQTAAGSAGAGPSHATISRSLGANDSLPRCDSFDNIDRLLDEPVRLPAPASGQRWRVNESLPEEAVAPQRPAADHLNRSSPADETEAAPTELPVDDWLSARSAMLRPYLLLGGGAIVGAAVAFGLATWYLAPPEPGDRLTDPTAVAAVPDEPRTEDEQAQQVVTEQPSPSNSPPPATAEATEMTAGPADAADEIAEATEPETPAAEESLPPTSTSDVPPPTPTAAAAEDAQPPAQRAEPPPRSGNDLAAFAQWLQNADAITSPAAAPTVQAPDDETTAGDLAASVEPPVIQPSRPAPPPVDVAARLKEPIVALQLKEVPLVDALRLVTQLSTIPIRLHPEALGRHNLRADHPVTVLVRDETVGGLLDAMLDKTKLSWYVDGDHVIVTTAVDAQGQLVTVRHPVADLTGGNLAVAQDLAGYIQRLIAYGTWAEQGEAEEDTTAVRCAADESTLIVTHQDVVQYQVLVFCEKLRVARGLPPRTRIHKDRITLGSRVAACGALEQSVSLRIGHARNIDQIVAELSQQVPLQILVDWPALYAEGWSPNDVEPFFCEQKSLGEVLDNWLRPKGLAWRVVDGQTLEITTPSILEVTTDVEFYRLDSPPEQASKLSVALSRKLLAKLGQAAFQPQGLGRIAYDPPSQTLIVSLPQPQQAVASDIVLAK